LTLPDFVKNEFGTAVIWGDATATGGSLTVTDTLTLNNLASAAGRMGASKDLGAQWDEEHFVLLKVETGTAPAAGVTVELYLASSHDNTNWPGQVTGSDAAYPATPTSVANNKRQLGVPAAVLVAVASGNTAQLQQPSIWRPQGRYVVPVVINLLGQAFRNQGTPADNLSRVVMVPRRLLIQDAA
jgi:hypothetical protein